MKVMNEVVNQEALAVEQVIGALVEGVKQYANVEAANEVGELALPKYPELSEYVLEQLENKRIQWEVGAYRKSKQELYGILSLCLFYSSCPEDTKVAKKRNAVLDHFCGLRNCKVSNDTPTATKVVRAVFGNVDRRRISTYSLVVRAALDAKIAPVDMPEWIEKHGGVEEIRLGGKDGQLTVAEQLVEAKNDLDKKRSIAIIHDEVLSLGAGSDYVGKTCLLVAEYQANGDYNIKDVVTADGAVNAALLSLFKAKKAEQRKTYKNLVAA